MRVDAMIEALRRFPQGAVVVCEQPRVYAPISGNENSVSGWQYFELDARSYDLPMDWRPGLVDEPEPERQAAKPIGIISLVKLIREVANESIEVRINEINRSMMPLTEAERQIKELENRRMQLISAKHVADALFAKGFCIKE